MMIQLRHGFTILVNLTAVPAVNPWFVIVINSSPTVIDVELTMEAPESIVVSSAMDTLVHCVDSFGSVKHTPMSRMYSIAGFNYTLNVLAENLHMDVIQF